MDYKVEFATQTERDPFSITQFLPEKSPAAAQRLGDSLIDVALSLGSLPGRGGLVVGRPGVLKLVHLPYHVIFYRIDQAQRLVEILRFWDGRRDPADLTASINSESRFLPGKSEFTANIPIRNAALSSPNGTA